MLEIHQLPGRLRIRTSVLKGNKALALTLIESLRQLAGVLSVHVNALTGSVLITYNVQLTHKAPIFRELTKLRVISGILAFPRPFPPQALPVKLMRSHLQKDTQKALKMIGLLALKLIFAALLEHTASSAAKMLIKKAL